MNAGDISASPDERENIGSDVKTHESGSILPDETTLASIGQLRVLLDLGSRSGYTHAKEGPQFEQALRKVAEAAEQSQHLGLADIAVRLSEHVALPLGHEASSDAASLRARLERFAAAAEGYVGQPSLFSAQEELLACIETEEGRQPLVSSDEIAILRLMLGMPPADTGELPQLQDAPSSEAEEVKVIPENEIERAIAIADSTGVQRVEAGVLEFLIDEARPVLSTFSELIAAACNASDDDERRGLVEAAIGELESLGRGADFSGLAALTRLLQRVRVGLAEAAATPEGNALFSAMLGLEPRVLAYLADPTSREEALSLVALFEEPGWSDGLLSSDTIASTAKALAAVEIIDTGPSGEARPVEAHADDVSLNLPEDIDPELLDGLLIELPIQTAAFAQATQRIVSGRGMRDDIEVAKRAAHTLKGAANTVGVRGVAVLTHHLEDILVALSVDGVLPNLGLSQTLNYAADCLEGMSEALVGVGEPPGDAVNVLQDVLNWANRIDTHGIEIASGDTAVEQTAPSELKETDVNPVHDRDQPIAMVRVPAPLIDELLRLVGETMTSTAQIQNRISLVVEQARAVSRQNAMFQQLANDLETLVDLRGLNNAAVKTFTSAAEAGDFDALEFEQYNELHTMSRRLIEAATDAREMGLATEEHLGVLTELMEQQKQLHLENQNAVMSMRMVPVNSVTSRLQRVVRQTCRIVDKQVELQLRGTNTRIDSNILHDFSDALMHLLRNAVDHGIESAGEERIAAGKPPIGKIELSFSREGDYVVVRCADDGHGLDLEAIRAQAERRGIVAPGDWLSEEETTRLVMIPGFSTRDGVTQVSGRGIGMDAVNAQVAAIKGSLNLVSQRGVGLTVEIRLPVTLLTTHALLVKVRNRIVALSTRGVENIHYVSTDNIQQTGSHSSYVIGDKAYEITELEAVLTLSGDRRKATRVGWPVLIVRLESGGERAVVVQEVTDSQSLVVKPLGPYVPKIQGVVGATILGDGSVAPVIDLPELLYSPSYARLMDSSGESGEEEDDSTSGQVRVLVVDDSISARRSVAQVVRDAGYDVRTASDGLDAVMLLKQRVPDLIITDMEMPRMNGFELTQHVRAQHATHHVPVIMVTSRSTEKHRHQAELAGIDVYLTKPFNERELLKYVDSLAHQEK